MSMDFVPARRSNNAARPEGFHLVIQRVDRKSRSGRPTSLNFRVTDEAIKEWGIQDGTSVTGHHHEGIWEIRPCKESQSGFVLRISGKFGSKVRTCPDGWGAFRLSCTKAQADKVGMTEMKFFELVEVKNGSAFFIEKEKDTGIGFYPARRRAI